MKLSRRSSVLFERSGVAMDDKSDRKELERRLAQAKRMVALLNDPVTTERLQKLVKDLEEQLREPE
jgi:predicted GTPase